MRLDTPEKRMAARWIPPNSRPVPHPRGEAVAVVYVSESANGKAYAVSYIGTAAHAAHNYSFRDGVNRDKWVAEFFAGVEAHQERKLAYRAERQKPHDLKAGDIITNSWGYDQTNVDWYRITKATANYVWLQPIAASLTEDEGCAPMSGHVVPAVDTSDADPAKWGFSDLAEPVKKHKVYAGQHGSSVCFKYGSGSRWDGRAMYTSWYA